MATKKTKKPAMNLKDIKNVWSFIAWTISIIKTYPRIAFSTFVLLVLMVGGFSFNTPFLSFKKEPLKLKVDGIGQIGNINQKKR